MNNSYLRHFVLLALMLFTARLGWSQGSTTAAMSGIITDKTGAGLPGATVIAVHTPTNTQYVAPTNADGRFNIQNMRVGGPYTVKVTFVGYKDVVREGLNLSLGQNQRFDQKLDDSSTELAEVTVSGRRDPVINAGRTGASTTVQTEQIQRLPTLSRSFQDFTRLTPQATGSNSFGGRSNRANNISIDGAVNNDLFGLAGSGAPGGQAGAQPISLDAIQEFQVVLAPFDVRQGGFTGAGINAVTRSGTNKFEGSVFGFGRNQSLLRKGPTDYLTEPAKFSDYQAGFRLGGPIIKDKLFFFVNSEISRRVDPILTRIAQAGDTPGAPGISNITAVDAERVRQALISKYGYDPGSYGDFSNRTESNKVFARLDWNINASNQLTLRHNFVDAFTDNLSRSTTSFRFENNNYQFKNRTNSTVLEFNSKLGPEFSNNLIVGYQRIRDNRAAAGSPFPYVLIQSGSNSSIVLGSENFSVANRLDQDIVELTDNFTHFAGKHVITLGTHNEFFKFSNLFIRDLYGNYSFRSVDDFLSNVNGAATPARPYSYSVSYPTVPGTNPLAEFKVSQLGAYLQDEFSVTTGLRLTGGVRIDLPILPTTPLSNARFNQGLGQQFDVATSVVPTRQILFSPRLGFNWDVFNDQTTQVRGGTGIFTGRPPYVWLSNQYGNTGVDVSRISNSVSGSATLARPTSFNPDPYSQPQAAAVGLTPGASEIDVTSKNFKFPQQFRSNLAIDRKLPGDIVLTAEAIYSQVINDILYQDINLKPTTAKAPDGRAFYGGAFASRAIDTTYPNVILLTNTQKGSSYSLTGQAQKTFNKELSASVAYTYGQSKDVNSGTSSQAISNWRFNQVVGDPNNPQLAFSNYDLRHRVIASETYRKEYAGHFATAVALFYAGQSGTPFTYLYNGDVNGDGQTGNDLLYLPADLNTMVFEKTSSTDTRTPDAIKGQFINYVNNDPYLKDQKGQFTERNVARTPWTHQVDLRLLQDIYFMTGETKHTFQITFDVFNVGNLLNKDWGRQQFVANQSYSLLNYRTAVAADAALAPVGTPIYKYTDIANPYTVSQLSSRWQGQLGLRYLFN
ncbi:MAG: carboxypeptidase regulatory-like domain-containing protein [Bacteroidota bacterium]|nr:carboxypeptidase regulatory-like domain-containing protein [Bacteroidota bacterium]